MAYVALYRKYRSQSFAEVIGQSHVTAVLQNAIRLGRIPHAFLFTGPRGCGKTTTARLLAKALNCQRQAEPTPEPCGECEMCVRIRDGAAVDVIEMDAASETGIDDVREKIKENTRYGPMQGRYKVFIIDEVHDLSAKAFDSLLKTIEEPPPRIIFILATTEVHKVPLTIRSRCQRMDFRRGTLADLSQNLERVLQAEGIAYEPEALRAIAVAAEGSYRDSLSLLEQVRAYAEGPITAEMVHTVVGSIGPGMLDRITETLSQKDLATALSLAGELVRSGKDVRQALGALQSHVRDLLVARISKSDSPLGEIPAERLLELRRRAAPFTEAQLLAMLDILAEAERDARTTNLHRLLLERTLWRLVLAQDGPSTSAAQVQPSESDRPAAVRSARVEPKPPTTSERSEPAGDAPREQRASESPAPVRQGVLTLEEVRAVWPRVREQVVRVSPSMRASFTDEVRVLALDGKEVVVGCPNEFVLTNLQKVRGRQFVTDTLNRALGVSDLTLRCVLNSAAEAEAKKPAAKGKETAAQPSEGELKLGARAGDAQESDFMGALQTELGSLFNEV
jgi:DNA polymerase-3 subunit gamma/tau